MSSRKITLYIFRTYIEISDIVLVANYLDIGTNATWV
jgi:hypothetical protein